MWKVNGEQIPIASTYRVAWRAMAATTGFRTMYPSLIPPGTKHIHGVHSAGPIIAADDVFAAAVASSILSDFFIRASGISNLYGHTFEKLPLAVHKQHFDSVVRCYLRLNCLTEAYSSLWEEITGEPWTTQIPIANALQRQLLQIEIDVKTALMLEVSIDELITIYRTQFAVMREYDEEILYDKNGRVIPKVMMKQFSNSLVGSVLESEELEWTHPQSKVHYKFEYPLNLLDRELEMRSLYQEYS